MENRKRVVAIAIIAAASVGVGPTGCAAADTTAPPTSNDRTVVTVTSAPVPVPPADTTLSDGQIVGIAAAIDESEVEAAKLALSRSSSAWAHEFAESMVGAHTIIESNLASVARSQDITTVESRLCQTIKGEDESVALQLGTLSGAEFDRQYIDSQLKRHEQVLELLDTTLIPMARNPALKSALVDRRASVVKHLRMAEQVRATLGV